MPANTAGEIDRLLRANARLKDCRDNVNKWRRELTKAQNEWRVAEQLYQESARKTERTK